MDIAGFFRDKSNAEEGDAESTEHTESQCNATRNNEPPKSPEDELEEVSSELVALNRDREQLAMYVGELNDKNSKLRAKAQDLTDKLHLARQEKDAMANVAMKIEDLMWEQSQVHGSEVDELREALGRAMDAKGSEMAHLGGKEARLAQEVNDLNKEEVNEEEEETLGFFDKLLGGGNSSEEVKKLEEQLEETREEMWEKEGELEQHKGDRDYYEGQLAQMRSELSQRDGRLEDVKSELLHITSGAARKQQDRALKDAEKTVSYARKHLFHLFKSTGQERVREYTKEVFAGNWKIEPPGVVPSGQSTSGNFGRELDALEKRFKKLQQETLERDEEIKAKDREVAYLEEALETEKARAHKAEQLLLSTGSQNQQRQKTQKKTGLFKRMTGHSIY